MLKSRRAPAAAAVLMSLVACGSGGNLKADNTYHGSPPMVVNHPKFDPFQGSRDVTWVAPAYDRQGTIVAPADPAVTGTFEDYRDQDWFEQHNGPKRPPGSW